MRRSSPSAVAIVLLASALHAQPQEPIDADRPHVGTGTHVILVDVGNRIGRRDVQ